MQAPSVAWMPPHPIRSERQGLNVRQKGGEVSRQPGPIFDIVFCTAIHARLPQKKDNVLPLHSKAAPRMSAPNQKRFRI